MGDLSYYLTEIFEEVGRKREELISWMSKCAWRKYVHALDENNLDMQERLCQMKKFFWDPEKIGINVLSCSDSLLSEQDVDELLKNKSSVSYDPIKACWEEIKYDAFKMTYSPFMRNEPIEDIFLPHLAYASIIYRWSETIISEDENVAFESLNKASGLFDNCLGMVWFKFCQEKQDKLSRKRVEVGRKGGESKAEVYKVIQDKLVELIYKHAPPKGWKSKSAAVNELIEPLWHFVEKSDFFIKNKSKKHILSTMSQDSLEDRILKQWSTKNVNIRLAFDETVTRKKRTSN
ncbi:hypothetical protein WFM03_02660 [Yersinia enterocolitica]